MPEFWRLSEDIEYFSDFVVDSSVFPSLIVVALDVVVIVAVAGVVRDDVIGSNVVAGLKVVGVVVAVGISSSPMLLLDVVVLLTLVQSGSGIFRPHMESLAVNTTVTLHLKILNLLFVTY